VPDGKVISRFPRTLVNLTKALLFVDNAVLFDNSSAEDPYRFVAELREGRVARRGTALPRWWSSLGF
jgi:predicted ABC-type ATPase